MAEGNIFEAEYLPSQQR